MAVKFSLFAFMFWPCIHQGDGSPWGQLHFPAPWCGVRDFARDFAKGFCILVLKPPLSLEFANNLEMFLLAVGLAEVCFDKQ